MKIPPSTVLVAIIIAAAKIYQKYEEEQSKENKF